MDIDHLEGMAKKNEFWSEAQIFMGKYDICEPTISEESLGCFKKDSGSKMPKKLSFAF